jgi:hypothetical protein
LVDAGKLKSERKQSENGQDGLDFVDLIEPLGISVDAQQAGACWQWAVASDGSASETLNFEKSEV